MKTAMGTAAAIAVIAMVVVTSARCEPPVQTNQTNQAPQTNQNDLATSAASATRFQSEAWRVRRADTPDAVQKKPLRYSGVLVRAVKVKPAQLLHFINPFAPAEYGTGASHLQAWDSFAGPAPRPRAFRDPMTHEPVGLVSIGR